MSIRTYTQNLILLKGAERQGHKLPDVPVLRGDPSAKCVLCGKFMVDICEDAMKDTQAKRPVARCEKEESDTPIIKENT